MSEIKKCWLCNDPITKSEDVFEFPVLDSSGSVKEVQYWHIECARKTGIGKDKAKIVSGNIKKCSKCQTIIPEGEEFCSKCTSGTEQKAKESISFSRKPKTIVFIGGFIIMILILIGSVNYFSSEKVKTEFKESLESYLNNEVLKDVKYYKTHTLSGFYCNELYVKFENDFDDLSNKDKYNILHDIMEKYDEEREKLSYEYKLSEIILENGTSGLPDIYAYTLDDKSNRYEYSSVDSFRDKNGKLYLDYEMSDNKPVPSSYYINNFSSSSNYESSYMTDDEKAFAWTAALQVVRKNLKAPSTAKFPFSYRDEDIKKIGSDTFVVRSYVDAENSFGAKLRTNFKVKINRTGDNSFTVEEFNTY